MATEGGTGVSREAPGGALGRGRRGSAPDGGAERRGIGDRGWAAGYQVLVGEVDAATRGAKARHVRTLEDRNSVWASRRDVIGPPGKNIYRPF